MQSYQQCMGLMDDLMSFGLNISLDLIIGTFAIKAGPFSVKYYEAFLVS